MSIVEDFFASDHSKEMLQMATDARLFRFLVSKLNHMDKDAVRQLASCGTLEEWRAALLELEKVK